VIATIGSLLHFATCDACGRREDVHVAWSPALVREELRDLHGWRLVDALDLCAACAPKHKDSNDR
jgi:hypothetical protein